MSNKDAINAAVQGAAPAIDSLMKERYTTKVQHLVGHGWHVEFCGKRWKHLSLQQHVGETVEVEIINDCAHIYLHGDFLCTTRRFSIPQKLTTAHEDNAVMSSQWGG